MNGGLSFTGCTQTLSVVWDDGKDAPAMQADVPSKVLLSAIKGVTISRPDRRRSGTFPRAQTVDLLLVLLGGKGEVRYRDMPAGSVDAVEGWCECRSWCCC